MKSEEKLWFAFLQEKRRLYFRELQDLTKLSHSSLQNILKKLVETSILKTINTKAHVYYEIIDKKYVALKYSEIARKNFLKLNRNVRIPLENFLDKSPTNIFCIVLFGSTSRGTQKETSDIDLLIVHETKHDFNLLKEKINAISKYSLSIFECSVKDFLKNEDHLIVQAKMTGFPIKGEQFFYEVGLDEH